MDLSRRAYVLPQHRKLGESAPRWIYSLLRDAQVREADAAYRNARSMADGPEKDLAFVDASLVVLSMTLREIQNVDDDGQNLNDAWQLMRKPGTPREQLTAWLRQRIPMSWHTDISRAIQEEQDTEAE